jgi:hypothetical protein
VSGRRSSRFGKGIKVFRILRYLLLGALSVVGDVLVSLTASSIYIPKGLYLAPAGALVIVIMITATIDARRDSPQGHRVRVPGQDKDKNIEEDGVILRGKRMRKKYFALISFFCFMAAYCMIIIASSYIRGRDDWFFGHVQADHLTASICGSICVTLVTVGVFLAVGFRSWIGISTSGVSIRDERGRYFIRWGDVVQFYTKKSWGSIYLLAELPSRSPLMFRGPWTVERNQSNVIRLCDISRYGIEKHAVEGALDYWK